MGEAKRRGTPQARAEESKTALRAKFPAHIVCNHCSAELQEIEPMDVRNLPGMRLAGVAHCGACSHVTWALDGTPEGLELFSQFLADQHGHDAVSSGTAPRPDAGTR